MLLIDYKPRFYWWDCLEMLRKAILTGILMFFKKGSLTQLVMAMLTSLGFLSAAAWFEPFAAPTANAFKLGTEIALLMTLMLIVLLKIDLSKEDIPGGGDTVGAALLLVNVAPPAVSLVLSLLTHGLDARDAVKTWNGDEDGKKKGKEDEGELGAKEQLRLLFVENQSLKRQLADRRNDAMSAIARKKALEAQVADLKRDFEREEKATFSITADMTRQYKDMQEDLIKRINEAENTITELRDQLELQGLAYEDLKKEKDRAIAIKEAEIVDMKQKMDDMSAEFGDMLKQTLEKMSERINITNSNFDADLGSTGVPTEEKLQEFAMGK